MLKTQFLNLGIKLSQIKISLPKFRASKIGLALKSQEVPKNLYKQGCCPSLRS